MENPIKMDDLEVPLILETPIWWTPFAIIQVEQWNPLKMNFDLKVSKIWGIFYFHDCWTSISHNFFCQNFWSHRHVAAEAVWFEIKLSCWIYFRQMASLLLEIAQVLAGSFPCHVSLIFLWTCWSFTVVGFETCWTWWKFTESESV